MSKKTESIRVREYRLIERIQSGDGEAFGALYNLHSGAVNKIINKTTSFGCVVDRCDLEQAARIGMLEAARKFDRSRGFAFLTYAYRAIERDVLREANLHGPATRLPLTNGNPGRTEKSREAHRKARRTPRSLDAPLSDDGAFSLRDMIGDSRTVAPLDTMQTGEQLVALDAAIESLGDRDRTIIRMRAQGYTLRDTGVVVGLTKERVRQKQVAIEEQLRETLSEPE